MGMNSKINSHKNSNNKIKITTRTRQINRHVDEDVEVDVHENAHLCIGIYTSISLWSLARFSAKHEALHNVHIGYTHGRCTRARAPTTQI